MKTFGGKRAVATATVTLVASFGMAMDARAAGTCTVDAAGNATCSGGTITTPLTIYDAAAHYQPVNGSNSYTPTSYDNNPPSVFVTIDPTANFSITTNSTSALADKGIIVANYSNSEDPAVNNVTIDNFGTVSLTTGQIATSRMHAIVADSQVNVFTVNNAAGATIAATQTFFTSFDPTKLSVVSSNATAPAPSTYSARYNNATLNIVSALYSDDNTNSFVVNNAGSILASGHFAAAYYGRADTTITNSGSLGNTSWTSASTLASGHWAVATYAGADFVTLAGNNPDTPIYDVQGITTNAQGVLQGTLAVTDTSATTITNTASGKITGDILVLDTNPLVTAAASASGASLPLASSGSNSGPRDSAISNAGTIDGNFYLGSGTHVIDNAGTINGGINVDQSPSVGVFAAAVAGTVAGTYASSGTGTDASGNACPTAGANTTDPLCAKTQNVLASFVGGQSLTLTNEGVLTGDIVIKDQPGSVNAITLTGTGFSGNVIAVNGTGSNSLTLSGVTNLASVQNFSALDLTTSHVTVANGVSLVDGSTLATTINGAGGTAAAPSRNLGTIYGTLTLQGTTTVTPTFQSIVHNGDTFVVASSVAGSGTAIAEAGTALVTPIISTSSGALLLTTQVADPRAIPGLASASGAVLANLLSYSGSNATVQALGAAVESLATTDGVRAAGASLRPEVNGAAIEIPVAIAGLFQRQIDTRLDSFLYAQLPVSGRSADLGPSHPRPVAPAEPQNAVWASAIEGSIAQSGFGGVAGYTANASGLIGGYDRLVLPGVRVGGAFGYVDTHSQDNQALTSNTNVTAYQGLVYAALEQPNWYVRGAVAYGGLDYNSLRTVVFPGFSDLARGSHGGSLLTGHVEGGTPLVFGDSLVMPYAAFTYARVEQNAYAETSLNGAGLAYQRAVNESDRAFVGAKGLIPISVVPSLAFLEDGKAAVDVEVRAAYGHDFGSIAQTATAGFVGAGTVFVATGPTPSRDMLDYGVGLNMATANIVFSLTYNGIARSTYLEQIGLFRARYMF